VGKKIDGLAGYLMGTVKAIDDEKLKCPVLATRLKKYAQKNLSPAKRLRTQLKKLCDKIAEKNEKKLEEYIGSHLKKVKSRFGGLKKTLGAFNKRCKAQSSVAMKTIQQFDRIMSPPY
jgi:hypothetical protein